MLTVGDVVNRVFNDWLYPPDYQPTSTVLNTEAEDADMTLNIDVETITPEEMMLLGGGNIIEVNSEQMVVLDSDRQAGTITLSARGINGTSASSHDAGSRVFLNPSFTRKSVFDTVCDTIVSYYPDLYAIRVSSPLQHASGSIVEIPSDAHIPVSVWVNSGSSWVAAEFQHMPNFPGTFSHNAISLPMQSPQNGTVYITYHGPFPRPESESTNLQTIGFRDEWTKLLTVSTVLHIIGGRDIDTISQTHIAQVLQAEYQSARSTSIRRDMLQYERQLLERAKSSLYAQSDIPMSINRGM